MYQVMFDDGERRIEINYQRIDQKGTIRGFCVFMDGGDTLQFDEVAPQLIHSLSRETYVISLDWQNQLQVDKLSFVTIGRFSSVIPL